VRPSESGSWRLGELAPFVWGLLTLCNGQCNTVCNLQTSNNLQVPAGYANRRSDLKKDCEFTCLEVSGNSKPGEKLAEYTVETFGNQGRSPDQINLMTLHSSKGLEFQAVIMIGMEEGAIPSSYARTAEEVEEAGRLFYVGLTRAMSSVHLMYAFKESPLITQVRRAT